MMDVLEPTRLNPHSAAVDHNRPPCAIVIIS
jgi:hypothetical protein